MSTPDRLRIACVLLAPRDSEGSVRAPLPDDESRAAIRAMHPRDRARLTQNIDWVLDFEANETPERRTDDPARETTA